ncbi:hypothetical protein [Bradyrhizobium sp. SZCCHNRI2049]|uniref:hypothetical protein n=1 Tax=Bradyrhizobium sp. SZCCHNRI2049 TaxID=3057287 RepID=UPI0029160CCB|nr:hypothetical protein [Bradyrhizobium sp. SZCCHNRI2049]
MNYATPLIMGSPWWLPSLDTLSSTATKLVPVATLIWILFQFGLKAYDVWKHRGKPEQEE